MFGSRRLFSWVALVTLVGSMAFCLTPAPGGDKGNPNPGVMPPGSRPFGKTYGAWGAAWQQWCMNTTTANSPVTDTTGDRALVGQSGHVYFLAGTFGELPGTPWAAPNPVTRTVTIPPGKALCIPINNWALVYPEDLPGVPPDQAVDVMRAFLNGYYDGLPESSLECEVDGVPVTNLRSYRSQSDPFTISVPADNVQSDLMAYLAGYTYAPGDHLCVSDGYYVILAPLSVGEHTIHLWTGSADFTFCEVTYHLTVLGR